MVYNKIRLSSGVKHSFMKPYIMRNRGLVTPQLDNIFEKAITWAISGAKA